MKAIDVLIEERIHTTSEEDHARQERRRIATSVLAALVGEAGLSSGMHLNPECAWNGDNYVEAAVRLADALILRLAQSEETPEEEERIRSLESLRDDVIALAQKHS